MTHLRECVACGKMFSTHIDLLHYCDKCLSLDELIDYLHSDFVKAEHQYLLEEKE